jgi:hypothetical protein
MASITVACNYCCSSFDGVSFRGAVSLFECCDTCGERWLDGRTNYTYEGGDPELGCSWTNRTTSNVAGDECKIYRTEKITFDFTHIPSCGGGDGLKGSCSDNSGPNGTRTLNYYLNSAGECVADFSGCGGGPGQSRNMSYVYENLITDCQYKTVPPGYDIINAVDASEYISLIGNCKNKSRTVLTEIRHKTTPTCYLKVWARCLGQAWEIVPRNSPPTGETPPFENDPGCDAGGPGWQNDTTGCYRQRIENDSFCCEEAWDNFCQEEYQRCLDDVADFNVRNNYLRGPCNGPFVEDGPIGPLENGPEFTYEWTQSGNSCTANDQIVGNINWEFEVAASGPGTGKSVDLEYKYSFSPSYTPKWPSERDGPGDCFGDGLPSC